MKILLLATLLIGATYVYRTGIGRSGEDLQGRWKIVAMPDGWKKVPGMDVMVTTDEIRIRMGTVETSKVPYTLDPDNQTIDTHSPGREPQLGIFELDGDRLTLSVGAEGKPRPASAGSSDDGATCWVLERAPPL